MASGIKKRSLTEISSQIDKIKKLDLKVVDFMEVHKEIRILMSEYTAVGFPALQNTIYRARPNDKDKLFETISDMWAPRPEKMPQNRFGRANKPRKPVFYCSNREETAISELLINEGDCVTIMRCCSRGDTSAMMNVGFGFRDEGKLQSKDGKTIINWGKYKEEKIRRLYSKQYSIDRIVQECLLKNKMIDGFLNQEFRKEINSDECNYEYKITAAIASLYLDNPLSHVRLDAISYPSIRTGLSAGPNWAFTIESANKFYKPEHLETIEIDKIENKSESIKYSGNARFKSKEIKHSGQIIWEKLV
ncbi:MAG: hypothetical protein WC532_05565 [Candidatus Omnitrophota bacterium]